MCSSDLVADLDVSASSLPGLYDEEVGEVPHATQHQNKSKEIISLEEQFGGLDIRVPKTITERIHINHARRSKNVDVRKLKSTMWSSIQNQKESKLKKSESNVEGDEKNVSFLDALEDTAGLLRNESITLAHYFMSVLHLANEKNLELMGSSSFDDVIIR